MDQYLYIPFLGGWTSIYQLFWCELQGDMVLTHPQIIPQSHFLRRYGWIHRALLNHPGCRAWRKNHCPIDEELALVRLVHVRWKEWSNCIFEVKKHLQYHRLMNCYIIYIYIHWLVVTGTMEFYFSICSIGNFIIPTDELTPSFFRGVGQPPTSFLFFLF